MAEIMMLMIQMKQTGMPIDRIESVRVKAEEYPALMPVVEMMRAFGAKVDVHQVNGVIRRLQEMM